ncbi:hypothetical protein Vretimale_7524 [Volvox reticuliferus]|uniref:Uncharacterized protein n=1 Tax=Volvox reticuliferus TaxID=1737510 RepID=A0A8J4G945_9CHLO|nr:hypothetical protein Vretifemale_7567 [Volvox reticuliferus]GIM02685.1 hypothetical protein Vretimale_7524 [Volvox reticuliferus]
MDAGRPKRKRSELELLLGNGDANGLSAFSPRLPALSVSSPVLAEAIAESDEQLARRLHEELNGMRMTRRGSKAVTEDPVSLSPPARGMASPHKSKAETPKAHGGQGRSSLPLMPPIAQPAPSTVDAGASAAADGRALETCTGVAGVLGGHGGGSGTGPAATGSGTGAGTDTGSGTGSGSASAPGPPPEGSGEAVKRKRNSVPARELHLLLQQASSAAGRAEATLSPTRSARAGSLASARTDPLAMSNDSHHHSASQQQGSLSLTRRDLDNGTGQQGGQQHQHQPAGSTASAPVAMPPSPNVAPPPSPRPLPPPSPRAPLPPPPPSLLPPKLKQRYLSGSSTINRLPASASASEDNSGRAEGNTRTGSGGATAATATTATTAVTPNCVIGGARNSLLSSQSVERSSVPSQSQSQSHGRDGSSAGAAYTLSEAGASAAASAASLVIAGPRALAATGASIGGCSSTDETENDNDNSCLAAVAGVGDGGPSATSPKAAPALQLPPPLPPTGPGGSSQKPHNTQAAAQTTEPGLADHEPNGGPQWQAGTAAQPPPNQAKQGQAQGHSATGPLKVPKLPMIRAGRGWYRGRLMRESMDGQRVLVDVPGAPNPGSSSSSSGHPQNQPFWLPVTSDRIWRGSYKGKDWKYLGDGAWEPKPAAFKRGKQGSSSNGLPLPLPQWAVDIASGGADVETQALPVNAACATGVSATATGHRSKADRGCWSSPDETSDDGEAAEELQQVAPEGPSTRSGQRPRRRSSPTGASFGLGKAPPAATAAQVTAVAAGDLTRNGSASAGLDCPVDATTGAEVAAAARRAEAEQLVNAGAAGQDEVARIAVDADAPVATEPGAVSGPGCIAETGKEEQAVPEADDAVMRMASPEGASVSIDRGPTAAVPAAATSPGKLVLIAQREEVGGDGGEGCGALSVVAEEEEDEDKGEIGWTPGVTHPRKRVPRRAQRRQQRIRTPFDGLQLYLSHHQPQHNPYAFYPVLSDESGRDGDASDAEHGGGRRGSGDGTGTAPHLGGRRRAAARAAAVAAAAARAEAEAEEEELEEILLGRRPPRRDRFHPQYGVVGAGSGVSGRRNHHHQYHHRSRSGARVDSYLHGDSSGNPDDPYTVDGTVYVHGSSARPRASSRGNSQPAPEYMSVAGGAWEPVPWQAAGVNQMGDGGTEQAPSAPSVPPRNRRKGKPSRSRMDGEGDGWCCGEDDWELEARGGAWARMPEVLRRLYYTPCPAVAVATADGGDTGNSGDAGSNVQRQQQQQGRQQQELVEAGLALTYRQSGGGAYFGALQFFNKRRRAYEDDPTVSLDDLDLDLEVEVDDHEHDADYLPPYGTASGSRRSSGFGGGGSSSGRRCSANGGSGGAVKRQRVGDTLYLNHHNHQSGMYQQCQQQGHDSQAAMVALTQPRRRILVTCGLLPGRSSGTLGAGGVMAGAAPAGGAGDGGIPAGLAGLLEAALGQDTASAAAVVRVANGHDPTRWVPDVKMELESTGLDTAPAAEAVVDRRGAETDAAGATGVLPPLQGGPMPALAPGDPHGAHVALSDSSAAPSGLEDSKYCVVVVGGDGGGGSAVATAIDASGPVTCVDGSTGSAALLLQQQQQRGGGGGNNSSGGGAGSVAGGSSSPPPGVQFGQLRSNTPTRAKRTGRPPFAGLGAGAPMPKLPALSSTAAHRMQMVVMAETTGLATIAVPAAIPADDPAANSGGDDAAAAAAAVVEDSSHQPSTEALEANAQGSGEAQVPTRLVVHETIERPMGPNSVLPVVRELVEEERKAGGGLSGGCKLWHTAGGRNGGDGAATKATQAGAVAGSIEGEEATCQRGGPVRILNTVIGTGSMPPTKPYGGGEVTGYCVMDAIGALKFDKQPAMQQLAVRAQLEVEMRAAQHHQHGVTARQQDEQLLQLPQHHAQQQQRLLQGRGSSGRNGGSEIVRSGSLSAAASPPAPDPLISSLPSVEVVVNLFSARTPYGSAQQALTELVGASTALPLFQ